MDRYKITITLTKPIPQPTDKYEKEVTTEVYSQTIPPEDFDLLPIIAAVNWPDSGAVGFDGGDIHLTNVDEVVAE